jgi:tetratricopeptide (TPR) repeat protein
MRARTFFVVAGAWLLALASSSASAQQAPLIPAGQATNAPQGADDRRAESYFHFMMGHLYEGEYRASSQRDAAERAIEHYKKAYELDPLSAVIGEQLAEMYFISQQLREAVTEAQSVVRRDPRNLPARRLLARIYVRSLGDLPSYAEQTARMALAIEQFREIIRLDPNDAESALWLARLYRLSNQTDEAEQVLRNLLASDPYNAGAVEQLGQMYLELNRLTDAIPLLESFLERTPNGNIYDQLGDAYTRLKDLPRAEQAYRSAVQIEPDRARHRRGLAQSLFNQQRYEEALSEYERLIEMRPNEADGYLQMSATYRRLQRLEDAERQILLAKQRAPGNLEVIYNEATLYEDQGRYLDGIRVASEAVAALKGRAEVTPGRRRNLAVLYQLLGRLHNGAEDHAAAVASFQELQRLGPDEDLRARLLIIDSYRAARDLPRAFEEARQAVAAYPNDRTLRINQAHLYAGNGQPEIASQSLRSLLNRTPSDVEIHINVAQVFLENRRYAEAEEAIRLAESMQQPHVAERIGFLWGSFYERQQMFEEAERAFEGVLAANPRNSAVLNYYGYMLAERGVRLDEAVSLIARALAEEPANASYLDSMGWAYFKQDRLIEAEEYLRKAVNRSASNPEILEHLGDVLARSGRTDLAAIQWEKALVEWRRALPAEVEPERIAELERKLTNLKNRLAQQAAPAAVAPR